MDKFDKAFYAALVNKVVFDNIFIVTLVTKLNMNTCIEECLLTKSFQEDFVIIYCCFLKYKRVGFELYCSTCLCGITDYFKFFVIFSALKTLEMDMLAVLYGQFKPFGKCVYD